MKVKLFLALLILSFSAMKTFCQHIASGGSTTMIICEDSSITTLGGYNAFGEIGNGTIDQTATGQLTPVHVDTLSGVKAIACGGYHSLALLYDSTVWAWGVNSQGTLGYGTISTYGCVCVSSPIQVPGLSGIVAIAAGQDFSMALKVDGTVWTWGGNRWGQLGVGAPDTTGCMCRPSPQLVSGLSNVVAIAGSESQNAFAIKADGTAWGWGFNFCGQVGDGTQINRYAPVQIQGLHDVIDIDGGWYNSIALQSDGSVWTWGDDLYGEIGNGTINGNHNAYISPVKVNGITDAISVDVGGGFCYALKSDGTVLGWGLEYALGIIPDSNYIRSLPFQIPYLSGIVDIVGGSGQGVASRADGKILSWGLNDFGQLGLGDTISHWLPVQIPNICNVKSSTYYSHYINGNLYNDSSNDCIMQILEQGIPYIPVIATPGNLYTSSNINGYYSLGIHDSINYTITPVIPQAYSYVVQNPCPANYNFYADTLTQHDTSGFDFGFDVIPCYLLEVDISSIRKRRCALNTTYVQYGNLGLIPVDSVEIHVSFSQYDIPVSASLPYTLDPVDSSLVFSIGTLNPLQNGTIIIYDSIACIPGIAGLSACSKVWILPTNLCVTTATTGTNWDGSSISVDGKCINDSVRFVIHNNGNTMTDTSQYRIYSNNILVQSHSFQINSNDSLIIFYFPGGSTIRLEADQSAGHPGNSHPRITIEGCGIDSSGTFALFQMNSVAQDDADYEYETDCMVIRDSRDPNEKTISPEGVGPSHIILPEDQIDYVIHFQNTGNDTAYRVMIVDTLSNYLDLSTLQIGAASHPFTFSMSGEGVPILKFEFLSINLVDSVSDELKSSGLIKFKISPKPNLPLGTVIQNTADIYFDYNFPLRTNKTFVTLGNYSVAWTEILQPENESSITLYPNPSRDLITISSADEQIQSIEIYSIDGRQMLKSDLLQKTNIVQIGIELLSPELYFVKCNTQTKNRVYKLVKY